MKNISELLHSRDSRIKELTKNPRFKAIDVFYKWVNTDRVRDGYKPLGKNVFAIKTSHLSLDDLDFLVKKVQQSSNPGRTFWGLLKTVHKNDVQKPKP